MHPFLPILATCSGQRRFSLPADCCEEEEEEEPQGGEGGAEGNRDTEEVSRNCLKLWSLVGGSE